jgi:putative hydrolase of HD superfamily
MKPDIHRLMEFQKLLEQFSQIERVTHRRHGQKHVAENDTEHSYNLAISAWYLAQYFTELDRDVVIRFALVHDLVEVHAGDTYIYADAATIASKHERETAALEQLRIDWQNDFPEMLDTISDYENQQSPEAKFVYALDKIMPMMLIYINDGYTWQQENITPEHIHEAKSEKVAVSPEIKPYYDQLYALLLENRQLFTADKK